MFVFTIIYEHRAISCIGRRGQAGANPYRGCSEIVRKSCNFNAIVVQSPQPPHGNRTEPVKLPCYFLAFFCLHAHRKVARLLHDQREASSRCRAWIVQCHLRHVYGLRAYDFSNLYSFSRNKIVKAAEPVNPYENLTAASCLRTEAAQKRGYGQDTGSVD